MCPSPLQTCCLFLILEKVPIPEEASQSEKTSPKLNSGHTSSTSSDVPDSNNSPTHKVVINIPQESDNKTVQPLTNGLVKSEESDINDDEMLSQSVKSCDTDSGSHDPSCDHRDGGNMIVEDLECSVSPSTSNNLQYEFVASHFIIKVCMLFCNL